MAQPINERPFQAGDRVRLLSDIYDETEDVPPGYVGRKGEEVNVRHLGGPERTWDLYVAHDGITEGSFGVRFDEVEFIEAGHLDAPGEA